jgi:hypothetical protein
MKLSDKLLLALEIIMCIVLLYGLVHLFLYY